MFAAHNLVITNPAAGVAEAGMDKHSLVKAFIARSLAAGHRAAVA